MADYQLLAELLGLPNVQVALNVRSILTPKPRWAYT
jgi:hypothetical protein